MTIFRGHVKSLIFIVASSNKNKMYNLLSFSERVTSDLSCDLRCLSYKPICSFEVRTRYRTSSLCLWLVLRSWNFTFEGIMVPWVVSKCYNNAQGQSSRSQWRQKSKISKTAWVLKSLILFLERWNKKQNVRLKEFYFFVCLPCFDLSYNFWATGRFVIFGSKK